MNRLRPSWRRGVACWQGLAGVAVVAMLSHGIAQGQALAEADRAAQIMGPGQVVVSGVVPDEATRVSVIARARELYGSQRVVDQLTLGTVVAPPQWRDHVQRLLSPSIKQVSKGQLSIRGNTVEVQGEVANEALRQQVTSEMATALNPTYTVRNGLRISANEQGLLDQTLGNRIIEFEAGSAVLRPAGTAILDEMASVLLRLKGRRVEVVGHTDADGPRAGNVALSLARAAAVKAYLVDNKGLPADTIATLGMGPDRPVASNATPEGRARNRRIEFKLMN